MKAMKQRGLGLIALSILIALSATPQTPVNHKHRVVFEMNVPGPDNWNQLLGNMENIRKAFAPEEVQIEVVCLGRGLDLLLKTNSAYEERLKKASEDKIVLAACRNSMRARHVTAEDLFPFATTVDAGVAELVRKQEAGWSYLKAGE